MADLALQGYGDLAESRSMPGTLDATLDGRAVDTDARRAPTKVARSAGWLRKVPGVGGRLGGMLEVGSVLMDLGGFSFGGDSWLLGDDAPNPGSGGPETAAAWSGPWSVGSAYGSGYAAPGTQAVNFGVNVDEGYPTLRAEALCGDGTTGIAGGASASPGKGWSVGAAASTPACSGAGQMVAVRLTVEGTPVSPYVLRTEARPPAGSGTATATFTSRVECRDATGGTELVESSSTGPFGPGVEVAPQDARCPAGKVAVAGGVTATTQEGAVTDLVPRTEAPAWVGTIPKNAPGCVLDGASCALDLEVQRPGAPEQYVSCGTRPDLCTSWDPAVPTETPSTYRCTYGGADVGTGRCRGIEVQPANPESPLVVTYPYPRPETAPAVVPTRPAVGVEPAPTVPENAACRDGAAGVFDGVRCALADAFVPTTSGAKLDAIGAQLRTVTPVPQITSAVAWLTPPDNLGGRCFVMDVNVPFDVGTLDVFDTCGDGPFETWLREHRWLLSVVMWAGFVTPLAWWAWREYAPGSKGVA